VLVRILEAINIPFDTADQFYVFFLLNKLRLRFDYFFAILFFNWFIDSFIARERK